MQFSTLYFVKQMYSYVLHVYVFHKLRAILHHSYGKFYKYQNLDVTHSMTRMH